jgi:uncharacterized protein (TIGR00369 family)
MITEEHYRKLENMYHNARCNEYYSPQLVVESGSARLEIPVKEDFYHAAGAVHGSVYFKALDDVAYFSVNSLVENVFVLTTSFNILLTRPVSSGILFAVGKVLEETSNRFTAESILYNSENKVIARGKGNFVRSTVELSPDIGYR